MRETYAQSYDFDDTLIERKLHIQLGAIRRHISRIPRIYIPPIDQVPQLDRQIVDTPVQGAFEKASFRIHAGRQVYPHIAGILQQRLEEGIDIYGNTGRVSKKTWVNMTNNTLYEAGIAQYFKDVFYKPENTSTLYSKLDAIRALALKYDHVEHFDDNPADAIPIAALFPKVSVYIINYRSTGILFSRKELERFPNVRRIAMVGCEYV